MPVFDAHDAQGSNRQAQDTNGLGIEHVYPQFPMRKAEAAPISAASTEIPPAPPPHEIPLNTFDSNVLRMEAKDEANHHSHCHTVFAGSSTFAMWDNLEKTFSDDDAVNHGIGGSTLAILDHNLDKLVLDYKPENVVIYAGTNDIYEEGHSGASVARDFEKVEHDIHSKEPNAEVFFVSMAMAPARTSRKAEYEDGNAKVKEYIEQTPHTHYIDITPVLENANGFPKTELFRSDGTHPTPEAYELLKPVIERSVHAVELANHPTP